MVSPQDAAELFASLTQFRRVRLGGVGRLANLAKLYGGSNSAPDVESWQEGSLARSRWGMFGGSGSSCRGDSHQEDDDTKATGSGGDW